MRVNLKLGSNLLILLLFFGSGANSFALDDVIFGPEFTFVDLEFQNLDRAPKVFQRMYDHLVLGQPEGAQFTRTQAPDSKWGQFTSPNGWSIEHAPEHIALEFQMTPGTVEHFRRYSADMQDALFVSAANEGFFPAMFRGGGHINVSSQKMFGNRLLFRNFLVDLLNHGELFMGVFGYDTHNALPIQMLSKVEIDAVRQVIADFDNPGFEKYSDEIDSHRVNFTSDLHLALNTYRYEPLWMAWHFDSTIGREKYHAVHVNRVNRYPSSRIELRGVRPQASMDVWVRQISLLNGRIRYLETLSRPLPLRWDFPLEKLDIQKHLLTPPIDPQIALREFYKFVRESGQSWADHRDYLWPKWIADGELARFERSFWFLRQEKKFVRVFMGACERIFAEVP